MCESDFNKRDCSLLFDAMSIKSNVFYNKSTGSYEGFISYGTDIIAFNEDTVATEALLFMLVGMRSNWKYPIGYVLIEKISSENLTCLVSKALRLSNERNIKVRSVTCDGTSTNFSAMTSLGCKIGRTLVIFG